MPPTQELSQRARLTAFDGLRGIAIVLVVLSHGWTLWPTDRIVETPVVHDLFRSGDFAVSIFFVVGSFLATRALLRSADAGALRPGVAFARRVLRLGGQMYFLLVAVLVVAAVDSTDTYSQSATGTSVLRAATFTWNWYVRSNTLEARPDLGHLWYLAVDLQMFVVILAVVWLLRRRRAWLVVALAGLLLIFLAWRSHVYTTEGWYSATLRTTSRGDAPLTGALVAAALPFLRRLTPYAGRLAVLGALALVPLMFAVADTDGYFSFPGVLLNAALAAVLLGCTLAEPPRAMQAVLGRPLLTFLGRHSLSIYLWHYPVFWFVARHTSDWNWEARTAVAVAVTAAGALASELIVERRVQGALDSPRWRRLDGGIVPAATAGLRSLRGTRPNASGAAGRLD